jgi:hypothetical protein
MIAALRIMIKRDDEGSNNPREWENPETMLCWHNRYDLGDKNPFKRDDPETAIKSLVEDAMPGSIDRLATENEEAYNALSDVRDISKAYRDKLWELFEEYYVVLPLFLYDHSGITMRTSTFSCQWDSGQVGFIYISKEKAKKEYGDCDGDGWDEGKQAIAEKILKTQVEVYDQYLTGDVYGLVVDKLEYEFEIPDEEIDIKDDKLPWDHHDSCWGFFGTDENNGMSEHLSANQLDALKDALNNIGEWIRLPLPIKEEINAT